MNEISKLRLTALEFALERAHPDITAEHVIAEAETFYRFLIDGAAEGDIKTLDDIYFAMPANSQP